MSLSQLKKNMHRVPTFEEKIKEIEHPNRKLDLPNRDAFILRNSNKLTFYDDQFENIAEIEKEKDKAKMQMLTAREEYEKHLNYRIAGGGGGGLGVEGGASAGGSAAAAAIDEEAERREAIASSSAAADPTVTQIRPSIGAIQETRGAKPKRGFRDVTDEDIDLDKYGSLENEIKEIGINTFKKPNTREMSELTQQELYQIPIGVMTNFLIDNIEFLNTIEKYYFYRLLMKDLPSSEKELIIINLKRSARELFKKL